MVKSSGSGFNLTTGDLRSSASSLDSFGSHLSSGGQNLENLSTRLSSGVKEDKSGIGTILVNGISKFAGVAGKVFQQGGRVASASSSRFGKYADDTDETESLIQKSFHNIGTSHSGGSSRPRSTPHSDPFADDAHPAPASSHHSGNTSPASSHGDPFADDAYPASPASSHHSGDDAPTSPSSTHSSQHDPFADDAYPASPTSSHHSGDEHDAPTSPSSSSSSESGDHHWPTEEQDHSAPPLTTHQQHVAPVAAEPNIDPDTIHPAPVWKPHDGVTPVHRFDGRPPVDADEDNHYQPFTDQHGDPIIPDDSPFKTGFKPWPGETSGDLVTYQASNKPSMFVGTTTQDIMGSGGKWASQWRYKIQPPAGEHGVDVNATLAHHGLDNPKPNEHEIAFPGGIKPQYIVSAQKFHWGRPVGQEIPNPNFGNAAAGSSS